MYLKLEGFRSHTLTEVTFKKNGSNYIRGDNGAGKSDIYRALTWVLYGNDDVNIYKAGKKATVLVTLEYGNIFIQRQALPFKIEAVFGKTSYRGKEADAMIIEHFGTKEKWDLASYIHQSSAHKFISCKPSERMAVINRLTGNDEEIKNKIDSVLREAKIEEKVSEKTYEKIQSSFEKKYRKTKVSKKDQLDDREIRRIGKKIAELEKTLKETRLEFSKREMISKEMEGNGKKLLELKEYQVEEYENLKTQYEAYEKYRIKKANFEKCQKNFKKCPPILTQKDYDQSIVLNQEYKKNKELAVKYKLSYSKTAIEMEIKRLKKSLEYYEASKQKNLYRKQKDKVDELEEEAKSLKNKHPEDDPNKFIDDFERSLPWQDSIRKNSEKKRIGAQIGAKDFSLDEDTLIRNIENQWILDKHAEYNLLMEKLGFKPTTEQLENWKDDLQVIQKGLEILKCPCCDILLTKERSKLIKYEGKILENIDTSKLENKIELSNKILNFDLPEIPEGLVKINVKEARLALAQLTELKRLKEKYAAMEYIEIPEEVILIENISNGHLKFSALKKLTKLERELETERQMLSKMENPTIPKDVKIIDNLEETTEIIRILESIRIIEQPIDSEEILKIIEYHRLKDLVPEEVEEITKKQLDRYFVKYTERGILEKRQKELVDYLEKNDTKLSDLGDLEKEIQENRDRISRAKIFSEYSDEKEELTMSEAELGKKREIVGKVKEYKNIYYDACDRVLHSTLQTIKHDVNKILKELLSNGTTISIDVVGGNIKINFYREGVLYGDPADMSGGEKSILYFALIVVFNKLSNGQFLILDEATEGLTPDRKDDCIQYLLEYTKNFKKTLFLTDHSCHEGDYDKSIKIGK